MKLNVMESSNSIQQNIFAKISIIWDKVVINVHFLLLLVLGLMCVFFCLYSI